MRISKENKLCHDGTNTIGNQRRIIKEFLVNHPEIKLIQTRVDDGYTGTDFERPGFQQMLADMDNGANCIIVKDLSRLGSNYIGCGKYIERQFKSAGIRFISKERVHLPEEKWICSEASHEAIISKTLFETVQSLNKAKQNIPCVPNKSPLVGVAKCGNCGSLLSYQTVLGKCGRYRYYMCKNCAGTKNTIRI